MNRQALSQDFDVPAVEGRGKDEYIICVIPFFCTLPLRIFSFIPLHKRLQSAIFKPSSHRHIKNANIRATINFSAQRVRGRLLSLDEGQTTAYLGARLCRD